MGIIDTAAGLGGIPYALGGGRPWTGASCDCSSYVAQVEALNGVTVPAFTDAVGASTPLIGTDISVAQAGDIILYKYQDASQPGVVFPHMAIYAGGGWTYACQWPNGSGRYPLLAYPFEVHRPGGAVPGAGPVVAGVQLNPWLLVAGGIAALLLLDEELVNPDFYTVGRGPRRVIHPVRDSADYDPEVDDVQRQTKHEREQAEHYRGLHRGIRAERGPGQLAGGVDRPPWAVGLSNTQLERIAREHGVRASQENWWERAHLWSGTAELRRLLAESGYRQERTRTKHDAPTRGRLTAAQRRSARGDYGDLPF